MSDQKPNPNVPQIPQPLADVGALAYSVQAIKQGVDSLAGYRGQPNDRAVTFNDLLRLGIITAADIAASLGVTAIVAGAGLSGGTITATGTISLSPIGPDLIMGNPGSLTAVAVGVSLGAGLSLNAGGTLIAAAPQWTGGSVVALASTVTITSDTIGVNPNLSITSLTTSGSVSAGGLIKPTGSIGVQGNASGTAVQAGSMGEFVTSSFSNAANSSGTVTLTLGSPGTVNYAAHGLTGCMPVQFSTTGTLPTGLSAGTTYYTVPSSITTNAFEVATTVADAFAGAAINFTGSQTGTQTCLLFAIEPSATPTIAGALNLTAGDWDVEALVYHIGTSGSITGVNAAINTSVALGNTALSFAATVGAGGIQGVFTGAYRALLSGTTIVYAIGQQLGGATNGVTCVLRARRVG